MEGKGAEKNKSRLWKHKTAGQGQVRMQEGRSAAALHRTSSCLPSPNPPPPTPHPHPAPPSIHPLPRHLLSSFLRRLATMPSFLSSPGVTTHTPGTHQPGEGSHPGDVSVSHNG